MASRKQLYCGVAACPFTPLIEPSLQLELLITPLRFTSTVTMVDITAVRQSNARYASAEHSGLVCVFAGATSGIGHATLQVMATLPKNSTFYLL
jgi:hypothetical protein